ERVALYREAVSNGEMSLDEALRRAIEEEQEARRIREAEADARGHWLKEFAEMIAWIESYVATCDDERLAWYTLTDSPGLFDNGVTADRIAEVVKHLERSKSITFGDSYEQWLGARAQEVAARQEPASKKTLNLDPKVISIRVKEVR